MTTLQEANMTTLQEALPCPFCGKQHTLQLISGQELMGEDQEFWQHSESFGVVCDASQPEGKGGCGAMGGFKPTEEEAIEAWNTRTALAQQDESAQVQYLKSELAHALAQHREQQPVCHGCGIPAGDVHMSTCKSGKWPSRVSNGDTAAPAPQAQEPIAKLFGTLPVYDTPAPQQVAQQEEHVAWAIYDKRGGSKSIHWAEQHTDGNAEMYNAVPLYKAAPAPQVQEPTAWRTEALKWIRRKAEDQRATNEQNPRHAEAYPSWGERVRQWHWLADELELEQNSTSFGLEPYQEPVPQPAQGESLNLAREVLKLNALWNKSTVQAPEISDQLGICRVLAERVNTDD